MCTPSIYLLSLTMACLTTFFYFFIFFFFFILLSSRPERRNLKNFSNPLSSAKRLDQNSTTIPLSLSQRQPVPLPKTLLNLNLSPSLMMPILLNRSSLLKVFWVQLSTWSLSPCLLLLKPKKKRQATQSLTALCRNPVPSRLKMSAPMTARRYLKFIPSKRFLTTQTARATHHHSVHRLGIILISSLLSTEFHR